MKQKPYITNPSKFPIQPAHIDASGVSDEPMLSGMRTDGYKA